MLHDNIYLLIGSEDGKDRLSEIEPIFTNSQIRFLILGGEITRNKSERKKGDLLINLKDRVDGVGVEDPAFILVYASSTETTPFDQVYYSMCEFRYEDGVAKELRVSPGVKCVFMELLQKSVDFEIPIINYELEFVTRLNNASLIPQDC